jgi:ribosomal protein S7
MRARQSQLREKYRSLRHQPDPIYQSRLLQTFFNKFTKKGHRARQMGHVLRALRCELSYPNLYLALIRVFRRLHTSLVIVPRRKGKQILSVPVPARRNKRDTINLQLIYKTVSERRERTFAERLEKELADLTFNHTRAATYRSYAAHYANVYNERVNMEYRWK